MIIKRIDINSKGVKLEKISKGDVLVFPGREETVTNIDRLNGRLWTESPDANGQSVCNEYYERFSRTVSPSSRRRIYGVYEGYTFKELTRGEI